MMIIIIYFCCSVCTRKALPLEVTVHRTQSTGKVMLWNEKRSRDTISLFYNDFYKVYFCCC